ncbi:hypothetical protein [Synechococcus sp. BA-132 BA5]|uniref:hypothetical protein n=1 Tax=Synechococcus sp. BA-132 BA5 TaxID=3110252 RepID=UPI002B1F75E5|nr:hypothetical protein [Synechococcus sp. BA-132 BA5]
MASASTSYDYPVMLVRREGESFVALLRLLRSRRPSKRDLTASTSSSGKRQCPPAV